MAPTEEWPPPSDNGEAASASVVQCRGEYDMATLPELAEAVARVIASTASDVVLDLSDVDFMDASMVDFIVRAGIALQESSRTLTVASPSASARLVLDLCDLPYINVGGERRPASLNQRAARCSQR